jgi:hypothetical protein
VLLLLGAALWPAADVARADADQLKTFVRRDVIPAAGVNFVRVGDLDGDGDVDFAGLDSVYDRGTGNIIETRMTWWRQDDPEQGKGVGSNFSAGIDVRGASRDPDLRLGVGDMDGDGHQDLLSVEPNGQVSAWLNTDGSAIFAGRKSGGRVLTDVDHIEIANLDADSGDSRDDLLVLRDGRDVTWYRSEGEAGEIDLGKAETILRGSDVRQVETMTTGDFNGDGLLDLATAMNRTGGEIAWWLQRLDGEDRVFERAGVGTENNVRDLTFGDIDGDGDLDILVTSQVGNRPYEILAWLNSGDGKTFERDEGVMHYGITKDHKYNSIDTADINGDGALDFIASEFTANSNAGHLCWYENPGAPAPTQVPTAQPTPLPSATAPGSTPPSATPPGATPPPPDATPLPSATPPAGTPPGFEPIVTIHLPFASRQ